VLEGVFRMAYFPFFVELEDKEGLVVGGGLVAFRKVKTLLQFGAAVRVVSQRFCDKLILLSESGKFEERLHLEKRPYAEEDLQGVFFVIAATDDVNLNRKIAAACKEKDVLVNVVNDKTSADFLFPSLIRKGENVIGISSGGNSPILTKRMKKRVEEAIPEFYGELGKMLGKVRMKVITHIQEEEKKKKCFNEMIDRCEELKRVLTDEEIEEILQKYGSEEEKSGI